MLDAKKVGLALAVLFGIIYIVCALLFAIIPGTTLNIFSSLFHGIDISQIARDSVSIGSTIVGLIETIILAFIIGWLYAKIYNYFSR